MMLDEHEYYYRPTKPFQGRSKRGRGKLNIMYSVKGVEMAESVFRNRLRKLILEHVTDEHHQHGGGSHDHEPHAGYVEGMAIAHVEEQVGGLDFDEYAEFAAQYGYTSEADLDQLEEWWEAAIEQHRGHSFRDGFGDGYAPAPHGERRNNSRFFDECD